MAKKKTKLELTWIGKENRPRLEPRILIEDPEKSYHAMHRVSDDDIFDNRLIFGDNLLALKALEQEFAGKIKCIYIDPPFNTGEMFENYDDGIEHSLWLSQMRDRLKILHNLLAPEGTLFVHIDDNEMGYLIVLLDNEVRILFLSPFEKKIKRQTGQTSQFRNQFVGMLANAVFVAYAQAGGKLEQLCREILELKKTLYTFESDYNKPLIEMGAISIKRIISP